MTTNDLGQANTGENSNILGNDVDVHFVSIGNKTTSGKVDTGATTSSIHATDITVDKGKNVVSFKCPAISDNIVTMELSGAQEVHSADGGGQQRPVVKFDIEINGTPIPGALFNLNDRSNMDSMVLIGQNVLKAGDFQIDVNKDEAPGRVEQVQTTNDDGEMRAQTEALSEALQIVFDSKLTLAEIIEHFSKKNKDNL